MCASLAGAIAVTGALSGCVMGAEIDASEHASEVSQAAAEDCLLDASSIVFKYTEGEEFFAAQVHADKLRSGQLVEAAWRASWTSLDGSRGQISDILTLTGSSVSPAEAIIPMVGPGVYTVELTADADACGPVSKSIQFRPAEKASTEPSTEACTTGTTFNGGNNADSLNGGPGNDTLIGNGGGDVLRGRKCHDDLFGGNGDDELFGGDGDDYLDGGSDTIFGRDHCTGGSGIDQFLDCEVVTP